MPALPTQRRGVGRGVHPAEAAATAQEVGVTSAATAVTPGSRTRPNPLRKELVEMTNVQVAPEVAQQPPRLPELSGCGSNATVRFEIYRTRDGVTYGELAGTVNVCAAHEQDAQAAASSAGFLPFRRPDDVSARPCGSGIDFTGERPVALASRRREADPDFGRVRDVDQAHTEALAIEETRRAAATAAQTAPMLARLDVDPTGLTYDRSDIEETTTAKAGAGWALTGRGQPAGDPELALVQLGYIPPAAGGSDEPQGLADDPRTWWFTFPAGHVFVGRYAVTYGTYDVARAEVIASFGETFVGQFASAEEAGVKDAGLLRLRRDQWPAAVDEPAGPAGQPVGDALTQVMPAVTVPAIEGQPASPAAPEPRRVRAGELQLGMFVATGHDDLPGMEVRHVESSNDGSPYVGVVLAGPSYMERHVDDLVELVDAEVVEQAAVRARARAHRAQQIEALRHLVALAESDEFFPLPRFTLHVQGGLHSPEAVRRIAAVLQVPVSEDGYGARAVWQYGGGEHNPAVQVVVSAPHPKHTPPAGVR